MNSVIYNPEEEFSTRFKDLHRDKTEAFFEGLVSRSAVDIDGNRRTVKEYDESCEALKKLKRSLTLWRVLRVLAIITVILIPLVIWKMTPRIRKMREDISNADERAKKLLDKAWREMAPLNDLFTDRDALNIIEEVIPLIDFEESFSAKQESDMKLNYDFGESDSFEESTLDVLAGNYNGNPFLFENKLIHRMGTEVYHGYRTISWSETYRDSNGKLRTRRRYQTLHASLVKPKPFYSTQVMLSYCAQGGPDLSFSRDATSLHEKSEREIDRYVKRGEKKIKRKTDKAIRDNKDFTGMSNTDFEVLFDALDRNDEVQFRTLFTPLAQTNMVDLILSRSGYGDDFNFFKRKRTNKIVTSHSQGREINLLPKHYSSYSFDIIKANFTQKNAEFFKAVYFDMAPALAIPIYQERPVHSLKPLPDMSQLYSLREGEALANTLDKSLVVHPRTKTHAILKSAFVRTKDATDENTVTAYSYDIAHRTDVVPVLGGDGRLHNVAVPWDEYLPLEITNTFYVAKEGDLKGHAPLASRQKLCIFN